jgi:type-F conjugative transfer system pilin assembly protein TrbC
MLRFVILMLITTNLWAADNTTDAALLQKVQEFANDINKSLPVNPVLAQSDAQSPANEKNPQLIVFISTSMSKTSIKQWAKQADAIGAQLVIRGFVNNSFKDTVILAQELFSADNVGGFDVDPLKFKAYEIQVVPCVVLDVGGKADRVQGDIGLIEALKIIQKQGENAIYAHQYISNI